MHRFFNLNNPGPDNGLEPCEPPRRPFVWVPLRVACQTMSQKEKETKRDQTKQARRNA